MIACRINMSAPNTTGVTEGVQYLYSDRGIDRPKCAFNDSSNGWTGFPWDYCMRIGESFVTIWAVATCWLLEGYLHDVYWYSIP